MNRNRSSIGARLAALLAFGTAICLLRPASVCAFSVVNSTAALQGEDGWTSAVIDTTGGFAYFGSSTTKNVGGLGEGQITRVKLADLTQSTLNTVPSGFTQITSTFSAAVIDTANGFAYFVSSAAPISVQKVALSNFTAVSSTTFDAGWNWAGCAVADTTNGFAYIGTQTNPAGILKMRLSDLAVVSSMTVPSAAYLSAAVIDPVNGFAYFGSSTTVGSVTKLRLSDFSIQGTLNFAAGEGGVTAASIDTTGHLAYFGTSDSPGKVIKVNLLNFSKVTTTALASGEDPLISSVIDPQAGFVYFGTGDSPAKIVRMETSDMTEFPAITLGTGQNLAASAVIDATNEFAYFGLDTNPAQMVVVDLISGTPVIRTQPADASVTPGQTATFAVTASGRNAAYQWTRNGTAISGATSSVYSLTNATLADDSAGFACQVSNSSGSVVSRTAVLTVIPVIRVYPNPWRIDRHTGAPITFDQMAAGSTVKLFTLSAHWIKTLQAPNGSVAWDLTNDAGERVASGYYFYLVTTHNDKQTVHGKLAVIK